MKSDQGPTGARPISAISALGRPFSANAASGNIISKRTTAIYDRNLNKTRTSEVSMNAWAFLFSEVVQYTQKRVAGIGDLERR